MTKPYLRVMGIDPGRKFVGIAISDEQKSIAFPKAIVARDKSIETIVYLVKESEVGVLVIGLPHEKSGEESIHADAVRKFGEELKAACVAAGSNVEIAYVDERFSTAHAAFGDTKSLAAHKKDRRQTQDAGIGRKDSQAAAIILQRYLDAQ